MNPALVPLAAQLAVQLIALYAQSNASNKTAQQIQSLSPTILTVTNALLQIAQVFKTSQDEGWTVDDSRWLPVFDTVDKAQAAALARLT